MNSKILLFSVSLIFASMQFFGQDLNKTSLNGFKSTVSEDEKLKMNESFKAPYSTATIDSEKDLIEVLRLKFTCDANSYSDEAFVVFDDTDSNEGAVKMMSMYAIAPELWSVKNGNNYSISFLGSIDSAKIVPITVKAGVAGNYTLSASQVESFAANTVVSLEDRASGAFINLGISTEYTFQVNEARTIADRFFLHFVDVSSNPNKTITSVSENQVAKPFNIYGVDGAIKITSFQPQISKIAVYDILGHRIATGRVSAGANTQIDMNGNTGVYIVSVLTGKGIYNTKIIVK